MLVRLFAEAQQLVVRVGLGNGQKGAVLFVQFIQEHFS